MTFAKVKDHCPFIWYKSYFTPGLSGWKVNKDYFHRSFPYFLYFFKSVKVKYMRTELSIVVGENRLGQSSFCSNNTSEKDIFDWKCFGIRVARDFSMVFIEIGFIDVGERCWRRNVLVTSLWCYWPTDVKTVSLKAFFHGRSREKCTWTAAISRISIKWVFFFAHIIFLMQ